VAFKFSAQGCVPKLYSTRIFLNFPSWQLKLTQNLDAIPLTFFYTTTQVASETGNIIIDQNVFSVKQHQS